MPLMKGVSDDEVSLNHLNVVLQSLYHLYPLRRVVFQTKLSSSFDVATLTNNPLELVFAKMHYDLENRGGATDASIYFQDTYMKESSFDSMDSHSFYSWISKELMDFESFSELIQWEIISTKRTIENGSEESISDYYNVISVDPGTDKRSLQSYLNEDLFSVKISEVDVESARGLIKRTIESRMEITAVPVIAAFKLPRSLAEESPSLIFNVEASLTLPSSDKTYELVAVILYDPEESKFSVCLDGYGGPDSRNWWYRLQNDSVQKVSRESVLVSASKFAYMAFYLESSEALAAKECVSPKPSDQLRIKCLTKNTIHNISKTVQRQNNNNNSPPSALKPSNLPFKTKYMQPGLQPDYSLSLTGETSPFGTAKSASILSLPSLSEKHSPPIELDQLQSILIPTDLSNVKMHLITFDDFPTRSRSSDMGVNNEDLSNASSPVEDYGFISDADDSQRSNSQDEILMDYFEEPTRKASTVASSWASANYLNSDAPPKPLKRRGNLFSGLADFEIDFPVEESTSVKPQDREASNISEEEAAELFLKASLARVQKSRLKDIDSHFNHLNIELKPLNTKNPTVRKPQKFLSAQSLLTRNLFNRRTVLPLSSSEGSLSKTEGNDQESQPKQKAKASKSRYTKF